MNASLAPSESEEAIHTMARRLPPWAWLCLGVAFSALAGNRFNVGVLGWVASVPLLIHLRHTSGWRARLWLLGALQLGHFLNVLKIITEPIPWFFAPMFSVPSATTAFVAFLLFEGLRRQLGDRWGVALFPALVVGLEWLGATGSEMGSWGALAYTQLGNPALLQLASVFGLAGIGALLAATSGLLAVLLDSRGPERWMSALIGLAVVCISATVIAIVSTLYSNAATDLGTRYAKQLGEAGATRVEEYLIKQYHGVVGLSASLVQSFNGSFPLPKTDPDGNPLIGDSVFTYLQFGWL